MSAAESRNEFQEEEKIDDFVRCSKLCHTIEIEASARKGCRFCSLLLQYLKDRRGVLEIFRQIEERIGKLGKEAWFTLRIEGAKKKPFIWLFLPNQSALYYRGFLIAVSKDDLAALGKLLVLYNSYISLTFGRVL